MKRLLIIITLLVTVLAVHAKPTRLNVESLFDGRYNQMKNVTISIYNSNGNYYRGMTIDGNPSLVKKIAEAIAKDAPRAKDYSDHHDAEGHYTALQIVNNGETIYVGLQRDRHGGAFFFIQGKEAAFK